MVDIYGIGSTRPSAHAHMTRRNGLLRLLLLDARYMVDSNWLITLIIILTLINYARTLSTIAVDDSCQRSVYETDYGNVRELSYAVTSLLIYNCMIYNI